MKFLLNGIPLAETSNGPVTSVRSHRMWALVAFLALRKGEWVTRSEIADSLWREANPSRARQSLRQLLLLCAQGFGSIILSNRGALKLDTSICDCDIWSEGVKSNFLETSSEEWVIAARPSSIEAVLEAEEAISDHGLLFLQNLQGSEFDNIATSQFQVWVALGTYDAPIQILKKRKSGAKLSLRGHSLLACLYLLKGLTAETKATLEKCLDFEGYTDDIYYLMAFSQVNHFEFRLDLALEYAERASKLATTSEPIVYFGAVAVKCMLTEPEVHLPIARKYLQIATKGQFREHASMMGYFIALAEMRLGKGDVVPRLLEIKEALQKPGREGTTAKLLARVGQLLQLLGHREQAEEAYHRALSQARKTDGIQNVTEIETYLAEFYTETGDLSKALAYYTDCISIRRSLGHQWGLATSLRGAGFVSTQLDEHLEAEAYLKEALRLYEKLGDMMGCASVLVPFAKLFMEQKQYQKSLRCALAVDQIFGDHDDDYLSKSIPSMFATRPMLNRLLEELRDILETES